MTQERSDVVREARDRNFDLMATLRVLKPETLEVQQTVADGLTLRCPECGERRGVSVEPCFPISAYGEYLVFRDQEGEELGVLEAVRSVPQVSRQALEKELNDQHLIPIITRVNAISRRFHIPVWEVETDRGPRHLELKGHRDAHRLGRDRIYIRDAEGNGYLISDIRRLDAASRRLIETNM